MEKTKVVSGVMMVMIRRVDRDLKQPEIMFLNNPTLIPQLPLVMCNL